MVVPLSPDDAHLPSPLSPQSSSRHLLAATQIVRPMRAPDTYRGGLLQVALFMPGRPAPRRPFTIVYGSFAESGD